MIQLPTPYLIGRTTPPPGFPLGRNRTISPISGTVTMQFTADGGLILVNRGGNLHLGMPFRVHYRYDISLLHGKMIV
jgi:hypothetical protein